MRVKRPDITKYDHIPTYVGDMFTYLAKKDGLSVQRATSKEPSCSRSLVVKIKNDQAKLLPHHAKAFGRMLRLNPSEVRYLQTWSENERRKAKDLPPRALPKISSRSRVHSNQIVDDLIMIFLREAVRIPGFDPSPYKLTRFFRGDFTPEAIQRALSRLVERGFLKADKKGNLTPTHDVVVTDNDIPNAQLRSFYKAALQLAIKGLDRFDFPERCNNGYVIAMPKSQLPQLKKIVSSWMDEMESFEAGLAQDPDTVFHVTVNVTPIGESRR